MMDKQLRNIFVQGKIEPSFIAESIEKHSIKTNIGGHSIFLGQVRADSVDGKEISAIEYSTYAMRESIFSKYQLTCMHVHHSLGKVEAGEICLFVFTSSAHRKAAIDACEELVERIKNELPIWGKELFKDETYQWKVNR